MIKKQISDWEERLCYAVNFRRRVQIGTQEENLQIWQPFCTIPKFYSSTLTK